MHVEFPIGIRPAAVVLAAALLTVFAAGCASLLPGSKSVSPLRVTLALARGGLGDRSFNDSAYAGLSRAWQDFPVQVALKEYEDGKQTDNLKRAAQDCDLMIALGAENTEAIQSIAPLFPSNLFALVDAHAEGSNVVSVTFRELEGDFLAGVLCALASETGRVGFLGGADTPVVRRIEHGWRTGVLYANMQALIVMQNVAGKDDYSGFVNPNRAHDLACQMYEQGADVLYAPAGRSALGAIEAAKEKRLWIVTTGSDQRELAPGTVLSCRVKNLESVVFELVRDATRRSLKPGAREFDLRTGGIDILTPDRSLPEDVQVTFEQIRRGVQTGTIEVPPFLPR
jgi:basic membrane protein A